MADPIMSAVGNFLPYQDGSGYQVQVRIEQQSESEPPTISIEQIFRIQAGDWPQVVSGIALMLRGFPPTNPTAGAS